MIKHVTLFSLVPSGEAVLNTETGVATMEKVVNTRTGQSNQCTIIEVKRGEQTFHVLDRVLRPDEPSWKQASPKRYGIREIRYIGMASLLARLYQTAPEEEKNCIMMALSDFQEEFPGRFEVKPNGSGIWFEPVRKGE